MSAVGPEHATVPHSALSYFAAEAAETARLAARACRVPLAMARIESDGAEPLVGLVGLEDAPPDAIASLATIGRALADGRPVQDALPLGLQHVLAAPIASGGAPTAGFLLIATTDAHAPSLSSVSALRTLGRRMAESLALRRQTRELRATEAALRGSEARFRAVVEAIEEGLVIIDAGGLVVDLNPAAARLLGAGRETLKGTSVERYVDSAELRAVDPASGSALATHETVACRVDGSSFPASVFGHPIETGDARLLVVHIQDLSARKEIEQLRKQFISMVSHELRTPLTSVRASLGLLALGATGELPEAAQRVVAIAERNTERLVGLINDIIDLERAEGGHLRLELAPLEARAPIDRALEAVSPLVAQEGMTIEVSRAGSVLVGDAGRLTQVLVNLISNAVKFAPRDSRIVVSAEDRDAEVRFSVTDQGPGIPEAARDLIFQPFRQLADTDTRRKGGSGLGLAICRAIVERHGGRIGVDPAPGGGSIFHFTLPKEGPAA